MRIKAFLETFIVQGDTRRKTSGLLIAERRMKKVLWTFDSGAENKMQPLRRWAAPIRNCAPWCDFTR